MHEEKCLIGVWIKCVGHFSFNFFFIISLKISNPLVHSKIGRLDFIEITAGNNWKEEWSECISKVQKWTRAKTCFIYVSMWNMVHIIKIIGAIVFKKYERGRRKTVSKRVSIWFRGRGTRTTGLGRRRMPDGGALSPSRDPWSDLFIKRFESSELNGYNSSQGFCIQRRLIFCLLIDKKSMLKWFAWKQ